MNRTQLALKKASRLVRQTGVLVQEAMFAPEASDSYSELAELNRELNELYSKLIQVRIREQKA